MFSNKKRSGYSYGPVPIEFWLGNWSRDSNFASRDHNTCIMWEMADLSVSNWLWKEQESMK